jgi:hypothetical protein
MLRLEDKRSCSRRMQRHHGEKRLGSFVKVEHPGPEPLGELP